MWCLKLKRLAGLLLLLLLISCYSLKPTVLSQPKENSGHKYVQFNVLVIVLLDVTHDGRRTTLLDRNLSRIFIELERARLFYWRNSHLRFNINFTYMITLSHLSFNGWFLSPGNVRRVVSKTLSKLGCSWDSFDGIVALWAAPGYKEEVDPIGSVYGPGGTLRYYSSYQLDGAITWLFVHEFHHQVDEDFYLSGYEEYPHADYPAQLKGKFGEHFDFNAYMLRSWNETLWLKLKAPSIGKPRILTANDEDGDNFPDYDPALPIDEVRFGSYINRSDSDHDGLNDKDEFMAGIFFPSNPLLSDSDSDGIPDGKDSYPLYPVNTIVPRDNWSTIIKDFITHPRNAQLNYELKAKWNDSGIAFKFLIKPGNLGNIYLYLDLDDDGWFHGVGNLEIILNPAVDNPLIKVHLLDCREAEKNPSKPCLWDDDPKHGGRIITESDIITRANLVRRGKKIYKEVVVFIPKNDEISFHPSEGKNIGLRVEFLSSKTGTACSVFEKWSLIYLNLSQKALAQNVSSTIMVNRPDYIEKAVVVNRYIGKISKDYTVEVVYEVENVSNRTLNSVRIMNKNGKPLISLDKLPPLAKVKICKQIKMGINNYTLIPGDLTVKYDYNQKTYSLKIKVPDIILDTQTEIKDPFAEIMSSTIRLLVIIAITATAIAAVAYIIRIKTRR